MSREIAKAYLRTGQRLRVELYAKMINGFPMFPLYTPWKHQKALGFLVFSGGIICRDKDFLHYRVRVKATSVNKQCVREPRVKKSWGSNGALQAPSPRGARRTENKGFFSIVAPKIIERLNKDYQFLHRSPY